jgi:hypothetical protein
MTTLRLVLLIQLEGMRRPTEETAMLSEEIFRKLEGIQGSLIVVC